MRTKLAIDTSDENIIATIHLMNTHSLDVNAALDQSSRSGYDNGIDAWYFDESKNELFIYQSKLTESRVQTLKGLNDLENAREWLDKLIIDGELDKVPDDNHCLFNLFTYLSKHRNQIKKINFVLISLFEKMELEDAEEFDAFEAELAKSKLNKYFNETLFGKLNFYFEEYNLEKNIPSQIKVYTISKIPQSQVTLSNKAHLDLAYLPLFNLIELYRQRGNILFDKNVRLSLMKTKEAKERLVNPMEETLTNIVTGKLSASIFPFYHIGVTLAANSSDQNNSDELNIEAPSIINGCQTIVIANEFLKKLERSNKTEEIEKFKEIKVIAKVVIGTSNAQLMEITNSNNRQNPIENWQLFSNEPIHIEIESSLKDYEIFYERQKGKYDSVMKTAENAKNYSNSNGTFIKVVDLAQIVALSRRKLQWAAKPSDIFINKENHDTIFNNQVAKYPYDIVFTFNMFKALKRGLNNYLSLPTHQNSNAPSIFKKNMIRMHTFYLGLLYFYQNENKWSLRQGYCETLSKIANPKLVEESQAFYRSIVSQVKQWYTTESRDMSKDVSTKAMDDFFKDKAIELGLDSDGRIPFTNNSIDWDEYLDEE
ncbi:MAG: AIPR family protein [Ignavibacterium sp.]|nr:AIPR family protein [Ignavibacterium sp.]